MKRRAMIVRLELRRGSAVDNHGREAVMPRWFTPVEAMIEAEEAINYHLPNLFSAPTQWLDR